MVEPSSLTQPSGMVGEASGGLSLIHMIKTADPAHPDLLLAYMNANPQAVFVRDEHGATALHWAALMCNLPVIRAAVALGLPVHATSGDGMEPIHWACTKGWWQAAQELIQHGADINARNAQMATPVVLAAQYGHTDLVNVLVKRGADINLLDEHQDSALHWAAYQGMLATVGLLHHLGLSATDADNYGSTPVHLAVAQGQAHVVEYFLEQAEPSLLTLKDKKGRTPIAVAAELAGHSRRHADIRQRLSAHQASNQLMRLLTFGAVGSSDASKRHRSPFWFFIWNGIAAYATYFLLIQPRLSGEREPTLHLVYAAVNAAMFVLFFTTVRASPGFVPIDARSREAYEEELRLSAEQATSCPLVGAGGGVGGRNVQLCHTCHVVRPLRAKHCPICGRCVLRYDHHCPWVDNCVAYGNYLSFYLLQLFGFSACMLQLWACIRYLHANPWNWWIALLAVDFALSSLFGLTMVVFHAGLIARNLTTNENINWRKYPHLKRELAPGKVVFFNAFDGGLWRNILWRTGVLSFDDKPVRKPPPPGTSSGAGGCCEHDHTHRGHSHAHGEDEEEAAMLD
ncbi:hypothetical protein KFE25_014270 [Diacronema lutheri]|uniref:Palmitoyltransferase n=1 Tax=Diacronema lutheri TaxID=2081491 RepID=A0A8J5XBC1_DIALT|nr:hypothetical protein KFE25_014270 [Diacronema lutheri]